MPDPYRCAVCGRAFVVPSLARDHEVHHEEARGQSSR